MKCLIVLISLACLLHLGQSTPSFADAHSGYGSAGYAPIGYHGPLAKTVVLHDGHIADTPEVAAAKNLHYSAVHKAQAAAAAHGYNGDGDDGSYRSGAGGYDGSSYGSGVSGYKASYGSGVAYTGSYDGGAGYASSYKAYSGPLAYPKVLPSGLLDDTPEVAAAKKLHYSAVHKVQAAAAAHGYNGDGDDGSYRSGADGYDGSTYGSGSSGYAGDYAASYGSGAGYAGSYNSGAGYASSYKPYSGPLAYPKVLPSGLLADTHEVAAAKHAHLNAVAVTAREHTEKWRNNYYH